MESASAMDYRVVMMVVVVAVSGQYKSVQPHTSVIIVIAPPPLHGSGKLSSRIMSGWINAQTIEQIVLQYIILEWT